VFKKLNEEFPLMVMKYIAKDPTQANTMIEMGIIK